MLFSQIYDRENLILICNFQQKQIYLKNSLSKNIIKNDGLIQISYDIISLSCQKKSINKDITINYPNYSFLKNIKGYIVSKQDSQQLPNSNQKSILEIKQLIDNNLMNKIYSQKQMQKSKCEQNSFKISFIKYFTSQIDLIQRIQQLFLLLTVRTETQQILSLTFNFDIIKQKLIIIFNNIDHSKNKSTQIAITLSQILICLYRNFESKHSNYMDYICSVKYYYEKRISHKTFCIFYIFRSQLKRFSSYIYLHLQMSLVKQQNNSYQLISIAFVYKIKITVTQVQCYKIQFKLEINYANQAFTQIIITYLQNY
ncbi:hypothetical protein TTHERM_000316899 (macronuclear) [Tetrahymena thermophila SB210]|uniref:Uncharacterized protein n=1 Tax=Tetrahymena thermophila (strain SB210) TaxID=312017 RepID=W7XG57_TETTS|nr:hypothetical protein TTHERM_000316899 [Tetrahymena thermophila SB210]EWS73081.1 hypothetical protein TTHERM_000316899 [Tetrahymena thermophila SB210]|eukprot:XP_012654390.1 hypothetical protein TTHERM_000316899 [Tetrahymena thermophila SB210]